jgi:hypothetical protein
MPVAPRDGVNLRRFDFGDFARVNAANAGALMVDLKHDGYSLGSGHREDAFEQRDDEILRREIVVEHHDFEKRRLGEGVFILDGG